MPSILPAQDGSQDFLFSTTNGVVTIDLYTGPDGPVVIPATLGGLPVVCIGPEAFEGLNITSVEIPNGVTNIADSAFNACIELRSAIIPESVLHIGPAAFQQCFNLRWVTLPPLLTSIGDWAFCDCPMPSITIPKTVTNIGECAFFRAGLKTITVDPLNSSYCSVDGILFDKSVSTLMACPSQKTGNYLVPATVKTIQKGAFATSTLTSVTIPDSVASIGDWAFYNSFVNDVTWSTSVTNIGAWTFCLSWNITNFNIPDAVTSIGEGAFASSDLRTITIGSKVTYIGDSAFVCDDLAEINAHPANPAYSSRNGVLFSKDLTTLVVYPAGKVGPYSIPIGTAEIAGSAFKYCRRLTHVTLPEGITNISFHAFDGCVALKQLIIPASVATIGRAAFLGCEALKSVYFHGNAPAIMEESATPDDIWPDPADLFGSRCQPTIYGLRGTTGWDSTFAMRPVVVLAPVSIDLPDPSTTNHFQFTITGEPGTVVVVEACTALQGTNWAPLATNVLTDGTSSFVDPEWRKYPSRFYRLR